MKPRKPVTIAILGGGVIGITTGIILNLHGYKTKIYTKHLINKIHPSRQSERPPELATIHAAASIIPHSVDHPNAVDILETSQKFFHRLAFAANCGVRAQRHYELFEYPVNPPEYARFVKNLNLLPADGTGWLKDKNIPCRRGAKGIWGWYFNTFFAEGPTYMNQLYEMYEASGGVLIEQDIKSKEEFLDLHADVLINCAGRWAVEFFPEDKKNTKIVRGHMIKVQMYHVPHDINNQYFSYNYSPDKEVYYRLDKDGNKVPADVYFYPRSDGWLFGGSRQEGYPEVGEPWKKEDEQIAVDTFKKPEWTTEIPKPVWELNRELILDITNPQIDITDNTYPSFSYVGYRFVRGPIRIEKGTKEECDNGKLLLHNYGHGGAGYTLSWGSAYEILKIIEKEKGGSVLFRRRKVSRGLILSLLAILEDLVKEEFVKRKKDTLVPS